MAEDQRDSAPARKLRLSDFRIAGAVLFISVIVLALSPAVRTMLSSDEQRFPVTQTWDGNDSPCVLHGGSPPIYLKSRPTKFRYAGMFIVHSYGEAGNTNRTNVNLEVRILERRTPYGQVGLVLNVLTDEVPESLVGREIEITYPCLSPAKVGKVGFVSGSLSNEMKDRPKFKALY